MSKEQGAESDRTAPGISKASFDYSLLNPQSRLPPRSKTGCWTCRRRKVKCGEERPVCAQCVRLGQHCDYEVKYSFKDANKTLVGKKEDLLGNPAWDPQSRNLRPSPSNDLDDTADFITLLTEEDRERKAAFHEPGRFYVVANPDSFASLPEYSQSSTRRSSSTHDASSIRSGRASRSARHSQGEADISPAGNDTIILNRFEMPTDRPTEKKSIVPASSLAVRTRVSPSEQRSRQHQLPLPRPISHYTQPTSYSSTTFTGQSSRAVYQPPPLDTNSQQYYSNPASGSSSSYTPQTQQASPSYPRPQEFHSQSSSQYPASFQYAPITSQEPQQYSSFSRLLPQPTPFPHQQQSQQQQYPASQTQQQSQHLAPLQPPPLTQQQAPFYGSTGYTHNTVPSMYNYTSTSPTSYAHSPNAYASASMTPSYTQSIPGTASYAQTAPKVSYTQTTSPSSAAYAQNQPQPTLYGQPYSMPHSTVKYDNLPLPMPSSNASSSTYGYGWRSQGQEQGHVVQPQGRENAQEQGYTRYRNYEGQ